MLTTGIQRINSDLPLASGSTHLNPDSKKWPEKSVTYQKNAKVFQELADKGPLFLQ
jgi:hypothetical protein